MCAGDLEVTRCLLQGLTGKGKEQTLAAGPGFLVSRGRRVEACAPSLRGAEDGARRAVGLLGASGTELGSVVRHEPLAFAASPFVP